MAEGQSESLGPNLASPISPAPHQRDDRPSVGRGAARPPSPAARGPDERVRPSRAPAYGDREGRGETFPSDFLFWFIIYLYALHCVCVCVEESFI